MAIRRRVLTAFLVLMLILGSGILAQAGEPAIELDVTSPSVILMDAHSGSVLYESGSTIKREPASITKIMTLILVYEALESGRISLDDEVMASEEACRWGGSQIYLEPGEMMSVADLILAVAVGSANDGSVAVGEHVHGSHKAFVAAMNEKARELGMTDTTFANAHGLDHEQQLTTARDVAIMSRYLINRFPGVLEITRIWDDYVRRGQENEFWLVNTNRMLMEYPGTDGLKTGWTDKAGFGVSTTALRGDTRLIAVILGAKSSADRFRDAGVLLNHGFANYETTLIAEKGSAIKEVAVAAGSEQALNAVTAGRLAVTVHRNQIGDLSTRVEVQDHVRAPIAAGQVVGSMVVTLGNQEVGTVDLVAARDVPRASLWQLWQRILGDLWPFL